MQRTWLVGIGVAAAMVAAAACTRTPEPPRADQAAPAEDAAGAVVLVTIDGARWQDVFTGLDPAILRSVSGDTPIEKTETYARFWAATPEERRAKVMPFLWQHLVANDGTIAGNRAIGSRGQVANRMRFSYPGYAELLTGAPHDDVITSNDNNRYGFLTVLEWLKRDLALPPAQVAVFGSWETFNYIAESQEGAIAINAGYERVEGADGDVRLLSDLQFLTPTGFEGARHDVYTFRFAMAHLQSARPRVLYLAFDETDDWAHQKRYDLVLDALHRTDRQLEQLWTWLQNDAGYRGRTTLIVTVDHGRGRSPSDWMDHGEEVAGAEETWLGCFGPSVSDRGERRDGDVVEQRQVAATVAALAGRDFRTAVPSAAPPIEWCAGRR
ncbi:MAG: alkaline phosphatase family protein [Vicinamibacterales bacterium]